MVGNILFYIKQLFLCKTFSLKTNLLKCFIPFIFISFTFNSVATNYYISSSGSDSNSGTSENSAWKSLGKISNTILFPGDQVLFRRGDTFYGKLLVRGSGNSDSPILFSSYGDGDMPIISGLKLITDWEAYRDGIYRVYLNYKKPLNMVLLVGEPVALGRYPIKVILVLNRIQAHHQLKTIN